MLPAKNKPAKRKPSKNKSGKKVSETRFNKVLFNISEHGMPWKKALEGIMSSYTFNKMLDSDEERAKRYVRACEKRADVIAEQALNIADEFGDDIITLPDGREIENQRVIGRDRLRVDTRKWLLSKMYPKKYGDKMSTELTGKDGKDLLTGPDLTKLSDAELKIYHALLVKTIATAE